MFLVSSSLVGSHFYGSVCQYTETQLGSLGGVKQAISYLDVLKIRLIKPTFINHELQCVVTILFLFHSFLTHCTLQTCCKHVNVLQSEMHL